MEFFRGVPFVSRSVGPSVGVLPGPSRHCQTAEWLIASAFQCYIERKNLKRKSQHGGLTPAKGTESEPNCTSNIPPKGEENTNFERADTSSLAPGPEPRPTSSAEAGSARSGSVQDQESQCQPKQHAFRSRNVAE